MRVYNRKDKSCHTCRHQSNSKMVEANVVKKRPENVCMSCMKAGKHNGCEKKNLGKYKIQY